MFKILFEYAITTLPLNAGECRQTSFCLQNFHYCSIVQYGGQSQYYNRSYLDSLPCSLSYHCDCTDHSCGISPASAHTSQRPKWGAYHRLSRILFNWTLICVCIHVKSNRFLVGLLLSTSYIGVYVGMVIQEHSACCS